MPWVYVIEVELPNEFKSFGQTLEQAQLNLTHRWVGFAESVSLCNEILGKLKLADSFEDVIRVSEISHDHKQLCEVINAWFEGYVSAKEEQKLDCGDRFTLFKLMITEMVNNSKFGDKFRQMVINGNHHAVIKKVVSATFVPDPEDAPVVIASEVNGLKPSSYENRPKKKTESRDD